MPKRSKLPWYRLLKGRFHRTLEAALASDDARCRALAWVVMEEVGTGWGFQSRFAEKSGYPQGRISAYLTGSRAITNAVIDELAHALDRPRTDLERPFHPLGFQAPNEPTGEICPGHPQWRRMWAFWHAQDPRSFADPDELRERFPFYFPD